MAWQHCSGTEELWQEEKRRNIFWKKRENTIPVHGLPIHGMWLFWQKELQLKQEWMSRVLMSSDCFTILADNTVPCRPGMPWRDIAS